MKTTNASSNVIHPTAQIDPSAEIGSGVTIDEHATIGGGVQLRNGASVGARSVLEESCRIGEYATVGDGTTIRRGVVLDAHASVGDRCTIGEDLNARSEERRGIEPLHVGHARIDDDCRIEGSLHIGDMAQIQEGARIAADGYMGPSAIIGEKVQVGTEGDPGGCRLRMERNTSIGTGTDLTKATRVGLNADAEVGDDVRATGDLKVESRAGVGNRAEVSHLTVRYDQQVPADARISGRRCPRRFDDGANRRQGSIHPTARIAEGVSMGENVTIGAHARIGAGTTLLDGCDVRAHAHVGAGCDVGRDGVVLNGALLCDGSSVEDRATVQAARVVKAGETVQRNEEPADAYGTRAAEGWPKVAATARIHPTARVDPSATVCDGARIGPNTTIGRGCTSGERATLSGATLGAGARVHDDATVLDSTIEDRAQVGAKAWVECAYVGRGACIGGDEEHPEHGAKRAAVIGDGSEMLRKKNGNRRAADTRRGGDHRRGRSAGYGRRTRRRERHDRGREAGRPRPDHTQRVGKRGDDGRGHRGDTPHAARADLLPGRGPRRRAQLHGAGVALLPAPRGRAARQRAGSAGAAARSRGSRDTRARPRTGAPGARRTVAAGAATARRKGTMQTGTAVTFTAIALAVVLAMGAATWHLRTFIRAELRKASCATDIRLEQGMAQIREELRQAGRARNARWLQSGACSATGREKTSERLAPQGDRRDAAERRRRTKARAGARAHDR